MNTPCPAMHIARLDSSGASHCERILRSLPEWFGIETSLLAYVDEAQRFPTFVAIQDVPVAFITVREHFAEC